MTSSVPMKCDQRLSSLWPGERASASAPRSRRKKPGQTKCTRSSASPPSSARIHFSQGLASCPSIPRASMSVPPWASTPCGSCTTTTCPAGADRSRRAWKASRSAKTCSSVPCGTASRASATRLRVYCSTENGVLARGELTTSAARNRPVKKTGSARKFGTRNSGRASAGWKWRSQGTTARCPAEEPTWSQQGAPGSTSANSASTIGRSTWSGTWKCAPR